MFCPSCGENLEGELIYESSLRMYNDEVKALEVASHFGATKTEGRWGREIGLYSLEKDRITGYQCPECKHKWSIDHG